MEAGSTNTATPAFIDHATSVAYVEEYWRPYQLAVNPPPAEDDPSSWPQWTTTELVREASDAFLEAAYASTATSQELSRNVAHAHHARVLAVTQAKADRQQAVDSAAEDKQYQLDVLDEDASDNFELETLNLELAADYADITLTHTTATEDAKLAFQEDETDSRGQYSLNLATAQIERDLNLAANAQLTALTEANYQYGADAAFASAEEADWSHETSIDNTVALAKAQADVTLWTAQESANVSATQSLDSALNIPWTHYLVAEAQAHADWWQYSGRPEYIRWTSDRNAAQSAWQSNINAAHATEALQERNDKKAEAVAFGNAAYNEAATEANAAFAYLADPTTGVLAAAKTYLDNLAQDNHDLATDLAQAAADRAQAELDDEDPDEAWAEYDEEVAQDRSQYDENVASLAEQYAGNEADAYMTRLDSYASAVRDDDTATAVALLAFETDTAAAGRDFTDAQADQYVVLAQAVAGIDGSYSKAEAAGLKAMAAGLASASPSPWAAYLASQLSAYSDWTTSEESSFETDSDSTAQAQAAFKKDNASDDYVGESNLSSTEYGTYLVDAGTHASAIVSEGLSRHLTAVPTTETFAASILASTITSTSGGASAVEQSMAAMPIVPANVELVSPDATTAPATPQDATGGLDDPLAPSFVHVVPTIPRFAPGDLILANIAGDSAPPTVAPVAGNKNLFVGTPPVRIAAPGGASLAAGHSPAAQPPAAPVPQPRTSTVNAAFKEQDVLTILQALDPVVYEWWVNGRNRDGGNRPGVIEADYSEHWLSIQGWWRWNRYAYFDEAGVPHIRVDRSLNAFDVAEAIWYNARFGNLMQNGVNFATGFVYQQATLDKKFGEENAKVFAEWQTSAFGQGRAFAATLSKLYVDGVVSFLPGGNGIQIAADLLNKKVDFGTILSALPYIAQFGGLAVGAIVIKYGDEVLEVPRTVLNTFRKLGNDVTEQIAKIIQKSPTASEAVDTLKRVVANFTPTSIPGKWIKASESMSARARAYQNQITGRADEAFMLNGVKFDGTANGMLLEAKGPGYAKFLDDDGKFREWFTGESGLLDQAKHQAIAAKGTPVEWHVAEKAFADKLRRIFEENSISIRVINTPFNK